MTENLEVEEIWDAKQCAKSLGWSEKKLRNSITSGTGPPYRKVGGRLEFLPSQVALWQRQNVVGFIRDGGTSISPKDVPQLIEAVEVITEKLTQSMTPEAFRLLDKNKQDVIIDDVVERSVTQVINQGYALPPLVKLSTFARLRGLEPATLRKYIQADPEVYPTPIEMGGREMTFRRDDVVKYLKIEGQVPFFEHLVEITEPVEAVIRAILQNCKGK
jgi:predicted DNA-binding transcriptional regulator AlpA